MTETISFPEDDSTFETPTAIMDTTTGECAGVTDGALNVNMTNPINNIVICDGLVPMGEYVAATDYSVGDSVDYLGSSYVMYTDAPAGTLPTDTTYWQVLAEKGDTGEQGIQGVVQTVVAGTGISIDSTDTANPIITNTGGNTSGLMKLDQTTPQTTIGRFSFPELAVDTDVIYTKDGKVGIGTTTPNSTLQVAGSQAYAYVAKTANYTLTSSDYQIECTANSFTITLPTAVGIEGRVYSIKNTGTGIITVDGNGTETIDGELTQEITQWDNIKLMSNGANYIII